MTAGVVLMKSTSLAYWRGFRDGMMGKRGGMAGNILKHGWKRAPKRLLIKMFGKKGTMSIMGAGKTAVGWLTGTTAAAAGWVASAGLLASAVGEGGGQLTMMGRNWNKGLEQNAKANEKHWPTDPRRWGSWALWKLGEGANRVFGAFFGLLDILGTPFRYLIEAIRYPFLDERGRNRQRENLAKFDGRIREQFRRIANSFDFLGIVSDETGGWGNVYGDKENAGKGQKDLIQRLEKDPSSSITTYTDEDVPSGETIIINNQSSSSSSGDKSTSADTVTALEGALTDSTDGAVFVGGSSAYDILHKGA